MITTSLCQLIIDLRLQPIAPEFTKFSDCHAPARHGPFDASADVARRAQNVGVVVVTAERWRIRKMTSDTAPFRVYLVQLGTPKARQNTGGLDL
jgi:hypothetical protein